MPKSPFRDAARPSTETTPRRGAATRRVRVVPALLVSLLATIGALVCLTGAASGTSGPSATTTTTKASSTAATTSSRAKAAQSVEPPFPAPSWIDTVGPIALSSPTTGVINGEPVVAFGTESGYLYVVDAATGSVLPGWPQPVELAPGVPSAIESSPTIAYLNGPKKPPVIVVGAGSTYVKNQQGGLVAFNPDGTLLFQFHTKDVFDEWNGGPAGPDGYDEGVFSTPAVGDVTGNGQEDLVFGSWDHNLYALTSTGSLVKGFPIDTEDTIWSSPALVHLRGATRTEDIIVGGDASGRAGCHGGFITDYTYSNGAPHIVWQHCENQTIWSSPSVGVINSSGNPVAVVGTGYGEKPPYKSATFQLFAFYARSGDTVPGWPVKTAGPSFGSPAIGLLPGKKTASVVDTSWCIACAPTKASTGSSMVYAWSGNGKVLWSQQLNGPNDFSSPILVDLTGSGTNDVLVGSSDGLFPLSGADGSFMFGTSQNSGINTCSMQNAAAVYDVPGTAEGSGWHLFEACGGPVEVDQTGVLYDYPLPATPAIVPPWPNWRGDAEHDGVASATFPVTANVAR